MAACRGGGSCTTGPLSSPTRCPPPEYPEGARLSPRPTGRAVASAGVRRRGSPGRERRQRDAMAVNADVRDNDEDRLAALWEQPLDGDHVIDDDDPIPPLFAAPDSNVPRAAARRRTGYTCRSEARRHSVGSHRGRSRRRRADPTSAVRSATVGVALVVVVALVTVALETMTRTTGPRAPESSTPARRAAPAPPVRPTPATLEARRGQVTVPRVRGDERRPPIGRAGRARSRGAHSPRTDPTPPHRRARTSRPHTEPAVTPSTGLSPRTRVPTPPTGSSACDEFPPC